MCAQQYRKTWETKERTMVRIRICRTPGVNVIARRHLTLAHPVGQHSHDHLPWSKTLVLHWCHRRRHCFCNLFNISHTNCTPLIKTSPATKFLFLLFLSTQNKAPSDLRPKGQENKRQIPILLSSIPPWNQNEEQPVLQDYPRETETERRDLRTVCYIIEIIQTPKKLGKKRVILRENKLY